MQPQLFETASFEKDFRYRPIKAFRNLIVRFGGAAMDIIYILDDGQPVLARKVTLDFIHYVGKDLFGNVLPWTEITHRWYEALKSDPEKLARCVQSYFRQHDMVATCHLYEPAGRVFDVRNSRKFSPARRELRNEILSSMNHAGIRLVDSVFSVNKDGIQVERVKTDFRTKRLGYNYVINYGRADGDETIRLDWERYVVICRNGLHSNETEWSDSLRHRSGDNLKAVSESFVRKAVEQKEKQEELIDRASGRYLRYTAFQEFRARLNVPEQLRKALNVQLRREAPAFEQSEWNLSQALTWIGSHSFRTDAPAMRLMRRAGTAVLEHSLEALLEDPSLVNSDMNYNPVLLPQ